MSFTIDDLRSLCDELDVWGLRREKVLSILDPRAARHARRLSQIGNELCRRAELGDPTWPAEAAALQCFATELFQGALLVPPSPIASTRPAEPDRKASTVRTGPVRQPGGLGRAS
jgi:hypothetical protein